MPPAGGNPHNPDPRRPQPPFVRQAGTRLPGSGRHFNPYWHSGSRRRAPSWLLASDLGRPARKKTGWYWYLSGLVVLLFAGIIAGTVAAIVAPVGVATAIYTERYNSLSLDKEYALTFETTRIYDRKGILLYEKQPDEGLREYVAIDKIPKVLIDATTATEDPTFFENRGG